VQVDFRLRPGRQRRCHCPCVDSPPCLEILDKGVPAPRRRPHSLQGRVRQSGQAPNNVHVIQCHCQAWRNVEELATGVLQCRTAVGAAIAVRKCQLHTWKRHNLPNPQTAGRRRPARLRESYLQAVRLGQPVACATGMGHTFGELPLPS
jgi:hypothetical protein